MIVRFWWLILFLVLSANAQTALAQANQRGRSGWPPKATHVHSSAPADLVDGAQHPELIPDLVAYRLYLITVSEAPNASPEARKRQLAYLSRAGLKDNDLEWTIRALEGFRTKYNDLVTQYNETAVAADKVGGTPDYQSFAFWRDKLVRETLEDLRSFLSTDGLASLDSHVKNEKRHMKLGLQEIQP